MELPTSNRKKVIDIWLTGLVAKINPFSIFSNVIARKPLDLHRWKFAQIFFQVLSSSVPNFIEIGEGSRKFSKKLVDLTRNDPKAKVQDNSSRSGPNWIRASLTSGNIGVVNLVPSDQSHNQVIIGYRSRLTRSGKRLLPMRPEARYQPAGTLFTIDSTSPLFYDSFDVSCRCTTKAVPRQSSMISCKLPFEY